MYIRRLRGDDHQPVSDKLRIDLNESFGREEGWVEHGMRIVELGYQHRQLCVVTFGAALREAADIFRQYLVPLLVCQVSVGVEVFDDVPIAEKCQQPVTRIWLSQVRITVLPGEVRTGASGLSRFDIAIEPAPVGEPEAA